MYSGLSIHDGTLPMSNNTMLQVMNTYFNIPMMIPSMYILVKIIRPMSNREYLRHISSMNDIGGINNNINEIEETCCKKQLKWYCTLLIFTKFTFNTCNFHWDMIWY